MRVFVFSDLHDEEITFESLRKKYEESECEAVFILGDTTNDSPKFLEKVVSSFENCFFIPGNNESPLVLEYFSKDSSYLHGKRVETHNGLNLIGFGKSNKTPFYTPGELSEEQLYLELSKLEIDANSILLLHVPPKGVFDTAVYPPAQGEHLGSTAVLRIIEERQPFAVFCGHIHEHEGVAVLGTTTIIKVPAAKFGKYCVAEIDGGTRNVNAKFFSL